MQLFFNSEISETTTDFNFDKEESKHISRVLRKKEGDILHITNGKGWLFQTEISFVSDKRCNASVISKTLKPKPSYNLHLAVAPTKMNDRYQWFLEKATEIGITSITPIICDRSERKVVKIERFEKIIKTALKQSLQCYLPKLNEPISYKAFLNQEHLGQKFIAHCEDVDKKSLKNELETANDYTILIGPEGDFSTNEIELALQHQFIPVTLGNTRLRTETAAIVAVHSVAYVNDLDVS